MDLAGLDESGQKINSIDKYLASWMNDDYDGRQLALLGEYGCGKSAVSLKVVFDFLGDLPTPHRIPILIELRGIAPRSLSLIDILGTWANPYNINPNALFKMHLEGKLVLIFEGFDEMDMSGDEDMRFSNFKRIWEFSTPKSKILITGRPNYFLDDQTLKSSLGILNSIEGKPFCRAVHLEKFNVQQIETALRSIGDTTRSEIMKYVQRDYDSTRTGLYDLASRPALLHLISLIWVEGRLFEHGDNINSAFIINKFIDFSFSRQSRKGRGFPLNNKERSYFMIACAVAMYKSTGMANQINGRDLGNAISLALAAFPNDPKYFGDVLDPKSNDLTSRNRGNPNIESEIMTDVRSNGIIVNDGQHSNLFKFAHKSFFEYVLGRLYAFQILGDRFNEGILARRILNTFELSSPRFMESREIMKFTAETLCNALEFDSDSGKEVIARQLYRAVLPSNYLSRLPYLPLILSVDYLN
ncbi:hypothetical protein WDZ92_37075, partial [Nostoc sp. NIES-2111]